ncbi:MAG: hypothetical protein AW07_04093 [Candidatus Accumulibacter sp. SK-11]|nr:MAG: hypothetical protein AW07_04093 [Candidatus Accumulibacter sp. SK-11]
MCFQTPRLDGHQLDGTQRFQRPTEAEIFHCQRGRLAWRESSPGCRQFDDLAPYELCQRLAAATFLPAARRGAPIEPLANSPRQRPTRHLRHQRDDFPDSIQKV